MRCNKGEKEKSTGNPNFVYKADNLGTGKKLSWLKRFKSLIWNNIQEGIPEAAEPGLLGTQRLLTTGKTQKDSLCEERSRDPKTPLLLHLHNNEHAAVVAKVKELVAVINI